METVVFTTNRVRSRMSALHTHFSSHGPDRSYQLHAILLYVKPSHNIDSIRDSRPCPKYFSDTTASCSIL